MHISQRADACPADASSPTVHVSRARRLRSRAAILTAAVVGVVGTGLGFAAPAQAADHIIIGASGDHAGLQRNVGKPLARHFYGKLSGPVKNGALVNIETTVPWSQVASGSQDANIKRWAAGLKGKNIMVSFSHEPMAKQNKHWGSSASFIAAFKRMVDVFNREGSTSVQWVWNVTSHSFRITSSSPDYGSKWYPGDNYVDLVAGESYNRTGCGGANTSFANQIKEIFAFAGQHGKKMVVAEFASHSYSGRAGWISAAQSYMAANKSRFAGAFYYNPPSSSCRWHLTTSAEFAAMRSLVSASGFGA